MDIITYNIYIYIWTYNINTCACITADLERKVYDLKKYIKTLHETIPGDLPPMPSDDSRPVSCELPTWVAKDLNIKIKPMMLVRKCISELQQIVSFDANTEDCYKKYRIQPQAKSVHYSWF